jgi:D-sedoheptulose 7-phosphate isomerase
MEQHGAGSATSYLTGLARLFERVEVTGERGAPIALDDGVARAVALIVSRRNVGKVLLIGNGGSAAIVSHMQNDLCKAAGVRAMVFNEAPLLMALANDDGYDSVFDRPVGLWAEPGDVLIAVSGSGESENVVRAATLALEKGCRLITLTGFRPANRLRQLGEVNVYVPASGYGYVEMTHAIIGHCITDMAMQVPLVQV